MIRKNKATLIVTSLVTLLPIAVGLFLWERLPEQMPSHWDIHGNVDAWSSKPFAVFGMASLLLALHWLCVLASASDPKSKNYHPKAIQLVLWICPGISLLLNTLVYAVALGYALRVEVIMPLVVGLLFLIVGNLLPKMRQSYTMGIKLPWTLDNEENWNKTHRFAGWVWTLGGCLIMLSALLGNFWILLGIMVAMVLLTLGYSYLLYRKQKGAA